MKITCKTSNYSFVLSNIYAPNIDAKRVNFWNSIFNHHASFKQVPWLIGGDFNFHLNIEDKLGGRINISTSMQDLRDLLDKNELIDLNLKGNRYTWSNRRISKGFILRRLDRMLASQEWMHQYQNFPLPICLEYILIID